VGADLDIVGSFAASAALCAAFVLLSKPYCLVCNSAVLSTAQLRRGVPEWKIRSTQW
jgi:hypothetical protein